MGPTSDDYDSMARRRNLRLLVVALAVAASAAALLFFVVTQPSRFRPGTKQTLVEEFLGRSANDPASVTIQEILYGPKRVENGRKAQLLLVTYRERNRFGALVLVQRIIRVEDDQRLVTEPYESTYLGIASTMPWSANPNGP
jgi:hypothetical protein